MCKAMNNSLGILVALRCSKMISTESEHRLNISVLIDIMSHPLVFFFVILLYQLQLCFFIIIIIVVVVVTNPNLS